MHNRQTSSIISQQRLSDALPTVDGTVYLLKMIFILHKMIVDEPHSQQLMEWYLSSVKIKTCSFQRLMDSSIIIKLNHTSSTSHHETNVKNYHHHISYLLFFIYMVKQPFIYSSHNTSRTTSNVKGVRCSSQRIKALANIKIRGCQGEKDAEKGGFVKGRGGFSMMRLVYGEGWDRDKMCAREREKHEGEATTKTSKVMGEEAGPQRLY